MTDAIPEWAMQKAREMLRMPPREVLRKIFEYDEASACLLWKPRSLDEFHSQRFFTRWNTVHAGKVAGGMKPNGYRAIKIGKVEYKAHRLIWAYHHGDIGDFQIDHINHDRADNRIENLRLVSNAENQRNASVRSDSASGYSGVNWHPKYSKWRSRIRVDGRDIDLGSFGSISDAIAARHEANIKFGFHRNHGAAIRKGEHND